MNTILFKIDENRAVAYEYDYFRNSFESPVSRYEAIYYKAGKSRDTWIDYKRAIQVLPGTRANRIAAALADDSFHVDLNRLPACDYYRTGGIKEYYTPYDGYYDNGMWIPRTDHDVDYEAIQYRWDDEDLIVDFPCDISNSIISLNMIFYQYEEKGTHSVIYRDIRHRISEYYGIEGDVRNVYFLKFNIYTWAGLEKKQVITPIRKNGKFFVMPRRMEQDCFLFYNGVCYTYEVSSSNRDEIIIDGIDALEFDEKRLDQILLYQMVSTDKEMVTKMYIHCGLNNKYRNSVDFLLPIADSLIIYNGIDHEYIVEDDNAIMYPASMYSVNGVSNYANVLCINFTKG